MPKYYSYKIHGYYLYYTASCVIEAMHVHASDKRLTEAGSAKFFVKENGDTTVAHSGILSQRDIRLIQNFILSLRIYHGTQESVHYRCNGKQKDIYGVRLRPGSMQATFTLRGILL